MIKYVSYVYYIENLQSIVMYTKGMIHLFFNIEYTHHVVFLSEYTKDEGKISTTIILLFFSSYHRLNYNSNIYYYMLRIKLADSLSVYFNFIKFDLYLILIKCLREGTVKYTSGYHRRFIILNWTLQLKYNIV